MPSRNRTHAVEAIASIQEMPLAPLKPVDIDFYGEDVFNEKAMQEYLPKDICATLLSTINNGVPIDADIAGNVAHAMKKWALERQRLRVAQGRG